MEDEAAAQAVFANLHSPPAGCFASQYTTLAEQNTVGGTFYSTRLDLQTLLRAFKTIETANFTGRVLRVAIQIGRKLVNATALCFEPGSVQIMGSRNSEHMRLVVHTINDRLLEHGYDSMVKYISLDNKVAAGSFGFYVRLEMLDMNVPKFLTYYNPGMFPGLVAVWNDPDATRCTMVVFENGKVQVLGIEDIALANERFKLLCTVAMNFRVDSNIARQDKKSQQRDVCNRNRQQELAAMPLATRGNAEKRSMRLGDLMYEYMLANRHRVQDTQYHQGLQAFLAQSIAQTATGARAEAIKRMAGPVAPMPLPMDRGSAPRTPAPAEAPASPGIMVGRALGFGPAHGPAAATMDVDAAPAPLLQVGAPSTTPLKKRTYTRRKGIELPFTDPLGAVGAPPPTGPPKQRKRRAPPPPSE